MRREMIFDRPVKIRIYDDGYEYGDGNIVTVTLEVLLERPIPLPLPRVQHGALMLEAFEVPDTTDDFDTITLDEVTP